MPTLRAKGKIHRSEWLKICGKYEGGETIAQISRDYGCTAPAIRYIIKRTGKLKESAIATAATPPVADRRRQAAGRLLGREPATIRANALPRTERNLDVELRRRVTGDVAVFLVALDQAVLAPSSESVTALQDATDRLMRSAARVRIDLEHVLDGYDRPSPAAHPAAASSARPQRA